MLGVLRFILALLVLFSHIPHLSLSVNPGVVAVILFYLISGYLMGLSYQRFQRYSAHPVRTFYADRLLKLLPQYWLVVGASFVLIAYLGPATHVGLLNQTVEPLKVLLNLALLPANYVFEPLVIEALLPHPIVPPAWSLASEFHFYLLLPLLLFCGRLGFLLIFLLSVGIQITALFYGSGSFNSNSFGYRFIFGVLTFFMAGIAYGRRDEPFYRLMMYGYFVIYCTMLLLIAPMWGLYSHSLVLELLLGAVLGLPVLHAVLKVRVAHCWSSLDKVLGHLAYPIFISHFLVFFLCEKALGLTPTHNLPSYVLAALVVTVGLSLLLAKLQNLVEDYRLLRRGFGSMNERKKMSAQSPEQG